MAKPEEPQQARPVIVIRRGGRVVLKDCDLPAGIEIRWADDIADMAPDAPDAPAVELSGCRAGTPGSTIDGGNASITDCAAE